MEQYIKKSALVAEMEKEIKRIYAGREYVGISSNEENIVRGIQKAEDIIDGLEVTEVDLNEEIESYFKGFGKFASVGIDDCIDIAKHFFEIGLFSQLTWKDIKCISEIGEDFMNSEDSDNLNDEEYYTEILNKFKAQKGEV